MTCRCAGTGYAVGRYMGDPDGDLHTYVCGCVVGQAIVTTWWAEGAAIVERILDDLDDDAVVTFPEQHP